jgi:uncharacterized protein
VQRRRPPAGLAHAAGRPPGRTAVLLHGWEGSARSVHVVSSAAALWAEGFRVVRINMRDHGDTHHLNRGIFHSCRLPEMVDAVRWVRERFPTSSCPWRASPWGGISPCASRPPTGRTAAPPGRRRLPGPRSGRDHGGPGPWLAHLPAVLPAQVAAFAGAQGGALPRRVPLRVAAALPHADGHDGLLRHALHRVPRPAQLPRRLRHHRRPPGRAGRAGPPAAGRRRSRHPAASVARVAASPQLRIERSRFGGHCGFVQDLRLTTWLDDYLVATLA